MQHARRRGHAVVRNPQREQDHAERRRQREADPRRQRARIARARQPQRDAGLAAGRARQALAQRNHVGVGGLADPAAAAHQFLAEVRQVRDRPAEGGESQPQEDQEHGQRSVLVAGVVGGAGQGSHIAF
ncbi:hypothetical protein D3C72_1641130 [compost metagenome]